MNNHVTEESVEWTQKWMKESLKDAEKALANGEVPVGCIFIYKNQVIANGGNTVNLTKNPTRHAEMNCIDIVLTWCQNKEIDYKEVFKEIVVFVTVEPCIMCAAALFELNVSEIVYGCANYRFGGCSTVFDVPNIFTNHNIKLHGGVYAEDAIVLLKEFYKGQNPNAPASKVKKKVPAGEENNLTDVNFTV
ncbi:hypothetical protein RUM44_000783 [Polyplax serrata]|uniref:CMP/dCMP-type deaminase domain-containing protein n=1 Tax=Polyplax serrata TaxID=468196 RepID=A0ABR1B753_POLSC